MVMNSAITNDPIRQNDNPKKRVTITYEIQNSFKMMSFSHFACRTIRAPRPATFCPTRVRELSFGGRTKMAYQSFQAEYMQMPIVTRAYTTACVFTTLAVVSFFCLLIGK